MADAPKRREPTHIPCCWGSLYERRGCTCGPPSKREKARREWLEQVRRTRIEIPEPPRLTLLRDAP